MEKINKITKLLMYATFFAILLFFNSGNVLANIEGLPSKGYLDTPTPNSTSKGDVVVRGWFLDGSGVSKIEVLVDGKIIGQAQYGSTRLDVLNANPDYQNANSGYQYTLNTRNLTNGTHSLTVRETGNNGTTNNLKAVLVNVQNVQNLQLATRGSIDAPANNSIIKGDTVVRGWALDSSGVSKIEVLVDGKIIGQAQYGSPRPDVLKAYPDYQNANSGYQYILNTLNLTNGTHSLTVRGTGNNGIKKDLKTVTVNVQNLKLAARGTIDAPVNSSVIKGDTVIRGWALDGSGVSKIEVLVDGKLIGQAQYGSARTDVEKAYPEYKNANSGYQYTLNTRNLTNGTHSLTVRETGNNGIKKDLKTVMVNVQNLQLVTRGSIDAPANNSIIKGDTVVRGWFIDGSGVAKIEVLVDGKIIGQAQYGSARTDVEKAYPEYKNANSGYQFTLDTRNLTNGQHSLTVRETGNNGTSKELNRLVNVQNFPAKGSIDTPTYGSMIKGDSLVRGWFIDGSGVAKIEVLVDGKIIDQAQYGSSRADVDKAFPEYQNANSGYQFTLNTQQFADGQHTLVVKETGKNGATFTISTKVTVGNGNLYTILDLRKPAKITATDIVNFFNLKSPNSPLKNFAQSFIDAQNKYGVNAQYLVAHAIWETGWGGSDLRNYKHNLYGYGAYDVCPFTCGYYFPTGPDSINKVAYQVRHDYLEESGDYYFSNYGPTLTGMNVKYASDQNWKNGIANLMATIKPYDFSYYSSVSVLANTGNIPPVYTRDIPAGQDYPVNTIIKFPSGITAKVVNSPTVNFRSLPYVSSSTLISSLSQNTVVTILGYNTDVYYNSASSNYAYRWYRVSVNGQNGWLYGDYLNIANLVQANVPSSSLLIRSSTSTVSLANVLKSVSDGTYLTAVLSNGNLVTDNGWYKVYLPNSISTGWVSGDYIKRITQ